MPKANVQLLKRRSFKPFTKEVVAENHPEGKFVFTLRHIGGLDALNWVSLGDDLFVALQSNPLPPLDDQPVIVSKTACRVAMMLDIAQCPHDMGDKYEATEILMMMTDDDCLNQIMEISMELEPPDENASGGDAEQSPLARKPRKSARRS